MIKGIPIDQIVGLKSKMYSLVAENNKKIKKPDGFNISVVGSMRHKEYVDVLFRKK